MTRATENAESCNSRVGCTTRLQKALLYARTLRHLRVGQVAALIGNRVRRLDLPRAIPDVGAFGSVRPVRQFISAVAHAAAGGEIELINRRRPFKVSGPDWNADDMPKLWRYNLHYFDFLHGTSYSNEDKATLICDWIEHVHPGSGDGWEPYPLSLRIVNWLKYLKDWPSDLIPQSWIDSLALQVTAVRGGLERHLLANHLLKNAKALVFGGMSFSGAAAEEWLMCGLTILRRETTEQILPDGGHFERSPMYHCIVLEDYVDLVNLLARHPVVVPAADLSLLIEATRRATEFLRIIGGADDQIPLFNDSAHGIAALSSDLLAYADAVLEAVGCAAPGQPCDRTARPVRISLPDSGYFGYRFDRDSLIVDCGPIGPDYQPGHAHCDTLSYELCVRGRRIVVDSGVHDYEVGPMRDYVRSTRAHNTVMIDDVEQSEIWGAFRVARRARPLFAELSEWRDGQLHFRGAHDGYHRLRGKVGHEREFIVHQAGRWEVRDRVTGCGHHRIQSFIHYHPACAVQPLDGQQWRVTVTDGPVLGFSAHGGAVRLSEGWYCPEFGRRIPNAVLVIEWEGRLPMECGYVLEVIPAGAK